MPNKALQPILDPASRLVAPNAGPPQVQLSFGVRSHMRRFLNLITILLGAVAASCMTLPEIQVDEPLEPGVLYFDCDAPPGHVSSVSYNFDRPIQGLDGQIRIGALRQHPKWRPIATVELQAEDRSLVIGVAILYLENDQLHAAAVKYPGEDSAQREMFQFELPLGETLPFFIRINDENGSMRASFGAGKRGSAHSMPVSATPVILTASCSTAWAEINIGAMTSMRPNKALQLDPAVPFAAAKGPSASRVAELDR